MTSRRSFLKYTSFATLFLSFRSSFGSSLGSSSVRKPIVISTWRHGLPANDAAWKILSSGGTALDAVEAGVRVPEADPEVTSVGYGGLPDRDGNVTLDACIMDDKYNCGSVAYLENIMHPISVARMVMEKTPHVMLAGNGALRFALENGFKKENLLTESSKKAWQEWLTTSEYEPVINWENHDTIGMIALDENGNLSGACTTSGMAYKLNGRIGDSPIIGAGLYIDNEVGGATATGVGEEVIRICGSHLVVELMRQNYSPQQACEEAVKRIIRRRGEDVAKKIQIGFIALNKKGEVGSYCIHPDFQYAVYTGDDGNKLIDSKSFY